MFVSGGVGTRRPGLRSKTTWRELNFHRRRPSRLPSRSCPREGEQPEGRSSRPFCSTQLQDDLARSRLREAFWISLVAHLLGIILLALSPKLLPNFWHPVELRTAEEMIHDKEFTYLELPKDAQRPSAKAPDTKFLSDKNRIAHSKMPPPDRQSLESLRKGLPGPPGATVPQSTPSSGPAPPAGWRMPTSSRQAIIRSSARLQPSPRRAQRLCGLSAGSPLSRRPETARDAASRRVAEAITAIRTAAGGGSRKSWGTPVSTKMTREPGSLFRVNARIRQRQVQQATDFLYRVINRHTQAGAGANR